MSARTALLAVALLAGATEVAAQERVRMMVNAGQQATTTTFEEAQDFQLYAETGTLTLTQTIPRKLFVDGGAAFRIVGGLHAGVTVSFFKDEGTATVSAKVPHPFFFDEPRIVSGDVTGTTRRETTAHIQASWTAPTAGGIELTVFGGPSVFQTEQVFATKLNVTAADEVYPYDTLNFPGVTEETLKKAVAGYNVGADVTWRFARHLGAGALIRYSHGSGQFTPTGGQPVTVEVGGLHAGGGLRLIF